MVRRGELFEVLVEHKWSSSRAIVELALDADECILIRPSHGFIFILQTREQYSPERNV